MTNKDIMRIAKQSAKKLNLPSRRKRIIREWWEDVRFKVLFTYFRWYRRFMYKVVSKKNKDKYIK